MPFMTPGHVGSLLQETRLRRGHDLRIIADDLRIRYHYLLAIEGGRYGDLPGPTYAAGFVRAYAEYLGLPAEDTLRRFRDETQPRASRTTQLDFPTPANDGGVPAGAFLLVALIVAGCAYGVWFWLSSNGKTVADLVPDIPATVADLVSDWTAVVPGLDTTASVVDAATDTGVDAPVRRDGGDTVADAGAAPVSAAPDPATPMSGSSVSVALVSEDAHASASDRTVASPNSAEPIQVAGADPDAAAAVVIRDPGSLEALLDAPTDDTQAPAPPPAEAGDRAPDPTSNGDRAPVPRDGVVAEMSTAGAGDAPVSIPSSTIPAPAPGAAESADDVSIAPPFALGQDDTILVAMTDATTTLTAETVDVAPAPDPSAENAIPPEDAPETMPDTGVEANPETESPDVAETAAIDQPEPQAPAVPAVPETDQTAAVPETSPEPVSGLQEEPVEDPPEQEPAYVGRAAPADVRTASGDARIVLRASRDAWIQLRRDGELVLRRLLRRGDVYAIPPGGGYILNTSNAGGLEVYVDGRRVRDLGPVGARRDGVRLSPSGLN